MTLDRHVLIVEARYYQDIADQLIAGVTSVLDAQAVTYSRQSVPGVFEVPAAIGFALRSLEEFPDRQRFDGFVALGCVVRGETDHYDHICREASHALMNLTLNQNIALGFGILTCHTYEQAQVRAAVDGKNKGAEAALACLRMMDLQGEMRLTPK
jgi:6,7-dimethyl-8-ribityllumazine synthase